MGMIVKATVLILCFWTIFRRIDFEDLRNALDAPRWRYIWLAALTVWVEPVVAAVKWRLLMAARGNEMPPPPIFLTIRVVYTANFLSLLAPTALSADALRVWLLRKRGFGVVGSVSAMLVDRALGMAALLLLTLGGWCFARAYLPDPARWGIPWIVLAGLLAIVAAFLPIWPDILRRLERIPWLRRNPPVERSQAGRRHAVLGVLARLRSLAEQLLEGFQEYRHRPGAMFRAGMWNLAIQFLRVVQVFLLFKALGASVSLFDSLTFVPVIVLLSMLPITFYGIGVKEGAFVYLFSKIGQPEAVSLSVSLLTYPLILSALLPGAWFFLAQRNSSPGSGKG